jgi:ATP-binding cassette, subfamily F, member 3
MINLRNVQCRRGHRILFDNVNVDFFAKQRIAVVGANGAGKSTLLQLINGLVEPSDGQITLDRSKKIVSIAQEVPSSAQAAIDYVLDGNEPLRALQAKIKHLEDTEQWMEVADCYTQLEKIDGYRASANAASILNGLGFSEEKQQLPISQFSGGWRMRLNIARTLATPGDIMLLDEPTNHLDLEAIVWLENYLQNFPGLILFVSHDSAFMDAVATHVVNINDSQAVKLYTGNYSRFLILREQELLMQQKTYEKQQRQKQHMESFVERFRYKATKAKQAQSRIKALEKMELVDKIYEKRNFEFHFPNIKPVSGPLLQITKGAIQHDKKQILQQIKLGLYHHSRVGLLGINGAGKSSLLQAIAGKLPLAHGTRDMNPKTQIGYFHQHQVDALDLDSDAITHFSRLGGDATEQEQRNFLGFYGFGGERVWDKVNNFSGGEKMRLAFAMLAWQKPNLLLLDEPSNHLDLETKHALMLALQAYNGGIVMVSHDRQFMDSVVDELWLVAKQHVTPYDGSLQDYIAGKTA